MFFSIKNNSTLLFFAQDHKILNFIHYNLIFQEEYIYIVNRKITGIPKEEYWIQMQLQMETCNLNECDFLETRFCEYESKEEFEKDGTFTTSLDGKPKGIIMYYIIMVAAISRTVYHLFAIGF